MGKVGIKTPVVGLQVGRIDRKTCCLLLKAEQKMLEGYALEVTLTTANAAAQAWYGYEQVSDPMRAREVRD